MTSSKKLLDFRIIPIGLRRQVYIKRCFTIEGIRVSSVDKWHMQADLWLANARFAEMGGSGRDAQRRGMLHM